MITIISGTTSVTSATDSDYLVEGLGALDVTSGGIVSGSVTVNFGGQVYVESSGQILDSIISADFEYVGSGAGNGGAGTAINTTILGGEQDGRQP